MSRRPLAPPVGETDRRASRMALGGRLKSESRIDPFSRPVGVAGIPPPPEVVHAYSLYSYGEFMPYWDVGAADVITIPAGLVGSLQSHGIFLTLGLTVVTGPAHTNISVPGGWQIMHDVSHVYPSPGQEGDYFIQHVIAAHYGVPGGSSRIWSFSETSAASAWTTFYLQMVDDPPVVPYPVTWDMKTWHQSYAHPGLSVDIMENVAPWPLITDSRWIAAFPLSIGFNCQIAPHGANSHGSVPEGWDGHVFQGWAELYTGWWHRADKTYDRDITRPLSQFFPDALDSSGKPWQFDQTIDIYPSNQIELDLDAFACLIGVTTGTPEPSYQFWWKFDEASGLFHDSISDAASLNGHESAAYQRPPLAPDSTFSAGTAGVIDTSMVIPAIVPGPSGKIVFDWWVSNLDMTLTGTQVAATVTEFISEESYNGVTDEYYPLRVVFTTRNPSPYTKVLRFFIGPQIDPFTDIGIVNITGWDNPAHFQWKISPAAGTWELFMGSSQIGSGSIPLTWGGLWRMKFAAVSVGAGWDEFKVYGE